MYEECTFNPEINEISLKGECRQRKHICEKPKEPEFSFKPQINEQSRIIRSHSA